MLMHERTLYPQRPIRAALVTFLCLALFVGFILLLVEEIRRAWLLAFGNCLFISVACIGLLRLRFRELVFLSISIFILMSLCFFSAVVIMRSNYASDTMGVLFLVVQYLFYAVGLWGLFLICRGWSLYYRDRHEKSEQPAAPDSRS